MGSSGEKKIRASPAWREDLITEGNLRNLMDSRPWDKWVDPVKPLSFPISGWFVGLTETHDTYAQDLYAARLFNARKKRRSRATKAWMGVLKKVLEGMIACHCDLDILLDPFFQPVTPTSQLSTWYLGAEGGDPQAGLSEVLQAADDAAPWRIFYRKNLQEHPAFEIPRLPSKFYPSDGD
ncbi:unnamed protein product [Peronospora destructor]|uniref:Uncharacterized protein n=1 Tax=Peronospora destructor TaxID=86335 RepID=A0AAV0VFC6_9STRA|nr:unnamed protein product [Peronospora destructor]